MFRELKYKLNAKLESVKNVKEKEGKIKDALQTFFKINGYPEPSVSYEQAEEKIIIDTPSKILANEVTFRLGDITHLLKEENIKVSRIIIK